MMTRRQMLQTAGLGFGQLGLANLMAKPHFSPKAKHVVFLFLNGGASQVDTFDPKPMLTKFHGKPAPTPNLKTERRTGNLLASPFSFKKYGQSGISAPKGWLRSTNTFFPMGIFSLNFYYQRDSRSR